MGGDGGSIPGRADVVRTAGFRFVRNLGGMGYTPNTQSRVGSDKLSSSEDKRLRWRTCALTQEPLKPPLLGCRLGQLYNREALVKGLLHRKKIPLPSNLSHIESRKDVRDLTVQFDKETGRIACPITRIEFDAGVKGVFLWTCGCVLSAKALRNLSEKKGKSVCIEGANEKDALCPVCNAPYDAASDIIELVPDVDKMLASRASILGRLKEKEKLKTDKQKGVNSQAECLSSACHHEGTEKTGDHEEGQSPKCKKDQDSEQRNDASVSGCSKRPQSSVDAIAYEVNVSKKARVAKEVHQKESPESFVYKSVCEAAGS